MARHAVYLLLLVAFPAWGQTYRLRTLGPADGLGHVRSLALGGPGELWLATTSGLIRYDGARLTPDSDAPASVFQIAIGPNATRWLWAGPRLYRQHPGGEYRALPTPEPLRPALEDGDPGRIRLIPTRDGGLVAREEQAGLWYLDPSGKHWTRLVASRPDDPVRDFTETADGTAWVLTFQRLGRVTLPHEGRPAHVDWTAELFAGRHVRPHPNGLWVMTSDGVFIYHRDGTRQEVLGASRRAWFTLPDVALDGTLALTVEEPDFHGLFLLGPDGELLHRIGIAQGLRTTLLDAVVFDGEGGLWLGSEHGLDYLEDPDRLLAYPITEAGISGIVVEPATGALWAGTYRHGLFRFDGQAFERIGPARSTTPPRFGSDGAAHWIAFHTYRGVIRRWAYRAHGSKVEQVVQPYLALLPDGRGLYGRRVGVPEIVFDDGRMLAQSFTLTSLATGPAPRRRVWLVIDHRLNTMEGDSIGSSSDEIPGSVRDIISQFRDLEVRAMEADNHGRIWLATVRGLFALYEVAPEKWQVRRYGYPTDFPTDLFRVLDISGDRMWLGTDRGLFGFTLHRTEPWLRPVPLPGLNAGLPTEVIHDLVEDGNGYLWIVPEGSGTLYRYDPAAAETLSPPAARLVAVAVNDRPLPEGWRADSAVRLRADTTRLAFALAPGTFRRTADLRYEYRLLGLDTSWVPQTGEPTVRFAYLAPGRYTFEARAVRPGEAPGPVLRQAFVLASPFWRAPWFYALLAVGAASAAVAGVWGHTRRSAAQRRALEKAVAERTGALQREKAVTEAQARRLAELDVAKNQFFQNVSHELRTPLTLLLGPIRDARAGMLGTVNDPLARHLPLMQRNGERLLRLVNQLLDLARLDAGHLHLRIRQTDLVAFLRGAVFAFTSRAEHEGITLTFDPDTHVERLDAWVDRDRLEQVLANLLGNAFDFTPAGGRIRVRLRRSGGEAVVEVRDTGRGIAPEELPYVFERFHHTDEGATREQKGIGIGLALVKELVALHGGTVTAESEPGFGTRITVRLPLDATSHPPDTLVPDVLADGDSDPEPAKPLTGVNECSYEAVSPEQADEPSATVLVVEDHADLRRYLCSHLSGRYRVEEAVDGVEGFERARAVRPDLVISDVMMPRMDGFALCRALKEDVDLGTIPIIVLSARADEGSRLEGLEEGADDYLTKPFSAAELLVRCENLIEVRRRLRTRFSGEVVVCPTDVVISTEEADWLEGVKAIIDVHLGDAGFGVDWLADVLGLSTRQLQRRLKAASGLTPGAFLRTMRLERAAQLLATGSMGVAEVGAAVGYTDPEHFGRVFRQGFGVAPSAYAESARDTGDAA